MKIKGPGAGGPTKGQEEPKEPLKKDVTKTPTGGAADSIEKIPRGSFSESLRGVGGLQHGAPGGPGGAGASHVNSGPTGHSNGAGHANFSSNADFQKFENHLRGMLRPQGDFAAKPAFQDFAAKMSSLLERVGSQKVDPGGAGRTTLPAGQLAVGGVGGVASHVNSGPTGHSNGAGHANFAREAVFDKFINEARGLLGSAASHVNSGPTGHSNGAGHANFSDDNRFQQYVNEFENVLQQARGSLLGQAASHVNSGPTGHSNGAGHANFSDVGNPGDKFGNPGSSGGG